MKKLLLGLFLTTSLTSMAAPMLQNASCTGTDADGVVIKVNLHIEEDYYCSEDENATFKGVIVLESEMLGQEVFIGESFDSEENGKFKFGIKQIEVFAEGNVSIEANYDYDSGKGEFKMVAIPIDGSEVDSEVYKLTCDPIHYHMDCSK